MRRVILGVLFATIAVAGLMTPAQGDPPVDTWVRVNDSGLFPINVLETDPAFAFNPSGDGVMVFTRPAGLSSNPPTGLGFATSDDAGATWVDHGNLPGGSNVFRGDASVAYDAINNRFILLTENCNVAFNKCPPAFMTSTNGIDWTPPIDIWTSIPTLPQRAVSPQIVVDPSDPSGNTFYTFYTHVAGTDNRSIMFQKSTNGGASWSQPVEVTESDCPVAGEAQGFIHQGDIFATFDCRGPTTFTPTFGRSTDGGATFNFFQSGLPANVPYPGEPTDCPDDPDVTRTFFGQIEASSAPQLFFSPDSLNVYVGFMAHGAGTNQSFIRVFGGSVDAFPLMEYPPPPGVPDTTVTSFDIHEAFREVNIPLLTEHFVSDLTLEAGYRYSDYGVGSWSSYLDLVPHTHDLPALNPQFDSAGSDCQFGDPASLGTIGDQVAFGAITTFDAGPPGNNGVDQNVWFRISLPQPTTLTMTIRKTERKIKVSGGITPFVPEFGDIEVTLFKKKDGVFRMIGEPKTNPFDDIGNYKINIDRPARGTCRVEAAWAGFDRYLAATIDKTFSCKR